MNKERRIKYKIMTPKKKIVLKHSNGEDVDPITRASNVIFKNGKTAQEVLNDTNDNISDVIENSNSSFKVGEGDTADYTENVVDGAYNSMILKGKSAVNLIKDDMSTSNLVENGNGIFKTNEGMDEYTNIIDGEADELVIKGNSSYNILPDRTCCTDDVEVTDTKAFSFKDGLNNKVILDTGLSDKMVLKGNTLTNIVRDPIGYTSIHEVQDNIVPGSSDNVRVLKNVFDTNNGDYNGEIRTLVLDTDSSINEYPIVIKLDKNYNFPIKPNTTYTVIVDFVENTITSSHTPESPIKIVLGNNETNYLDVPANTVGRYYVTITSASIIDDGIRIATRPIGTLNSRLSFKNFMVIEGDCSDIAANLPYFKSTLSVNMEEYSESRPKLITGDCERTKIYGQTLVDVLGSNRNNTEKVFTPTSAGNRKIITSYITNTLIKTSTNYIVRFKISNLNLAGLSSIKLYIGREDETHKIFNSGTLEIKSNGIYYFKATTVSDFTNIHSAFTIKGDPYQWESAETVLESLTLTISEVSMYEYQEGMENWDLPYMVGEMRGTGLAKIESIVNGGDKEFVDVLGETRNALSKTFTVVQNGTSTYRNFELKKDVLSLLKTNTDYIIRFKISNINLDGLTDGISLLIGSEDTTTNIFKKNSAYFINSNGIYQYKVTTVSDFTNSATYLNIKGIGSQWEFQTESTARTLTISEVSLYEYTPDMDNMELPYMLGTKRVGYYGERKREYTLPSGLELRSLPNGVRDEFDFESGILTRRVGEVILDETKTYTIFSNIEFPLWTNDINIGFGLYLNDNNISLSFTDELSDKYALCNNFKILGRNMNEFLLTNDESVISGGTNNDQNYIGVRLKKSRFTETDITLDVIKNYLSTNPITVQYQLETPQYIDYSKDILEDGEYKVGERINGYQDGYNPTIGKYIKRIDKIVLDGITLASSIEIDTNVQSNDKCLRFYIYYPRIRCIYDNEINIKTNSNFKCITRKASFNRDYTFNSYIAVGKNSEGSVLTINIPKSYLFEYSIKGFKDYLSRNPITVSYVLADEVESNMTQEEFNALTNRTNPKLHYFKDGSLKCTCLSGQPKGQLRINTPTANYYDMQLIKPNTQYTVNNFSNMYIDGTKYQTSSATPNQLTTPNTITSKKIVINTSTDSIYPMMVEGVHDVNDIRFFGMKSSNVLMNTRGKNLFNKDAVIEGKYQNYNINTGLFTISNNSSFCVTEFIPVKPNTSYTKRGIGGGAYYDINKKSITNVIVSGDSNFTTPSNARYIVLNIGSDSDFSESYIMEASESDTTYEPYAQPHEFKAFTKDENGVLQVVELNRINDNLCDEIDLSTGIITRRVNKVNLSKLNYAWDYYNYYHDTFITFTIYKPTFGSNKNPKGHGNCIIDNKSSTGILNFSCGWNGEPTIDIHKLSLIKDRPFEFFKENNVYFIYELDKPYTEQAYIMIDGEFKTSLMLPNGVADGYNPITKVQTNRVKSITYDGNYSGNYSIEREYDKDLIELYLDFPSDTNTIISNDNKYFYSHQLPIIYGACALPRIAPYPGGFYLTLPKEKIGYNLDTLKQYLSTNPITIYYDAIETTETLDIFNYDTVVNNFHLSNKYGYKVENNNEIKLSKVIHHLPTANMLFCPLIQPSTRYYITGMGWGMIIDGVQVAPKESKYLDTPSTIASKKILVNGISFNPANHSLFKYTGYEPNLSRKYQGYMRSDVISNSRNNMITFNGKNLVKLPSSDDDVSKYIYTSSNQFTTNSSSYSNGKYSIDATLINTIEDSNNYIFVQLTLDQNYLFKKDKIYNFSFKIKPSSNITSIMPAIVKPNVTHIVRKDIILDGTEKTITDTLVPNITFKGSDYSSGIKFALDCTVKGIPEDKHVILEISDIILTESDNTTYEAYKEPVVNNYTIQRALTVEFGSINANGLNDDSSTDTVRTDFIKVIPGLMYYLYNGTNLRAFNIYYYNANKEFVSRMTTINTARKLIPDNVAYIRFTMYNANCDNLILKADLPLRRINDDIYDSIDGKTHILTRRVGRLTDLWKYPIWYGGNNPLPYRGLSYTNNGITNINAPEGSINILSNTLNTVKYLNTNLYSIKMQPECFVFRIDDKLVSENEYKEWFRQHPTDILYELATYETFDLSEYTDNVFTIPTLYKKGTIQLDSSSETYPIINYRTKVNNFYEFDCRAGNYHILANIASTNYPCSIRVNNGNAEGYEGDSVFTLPEGTNSVVFSDPKIKEVMVIEDNIEGNIPCYFKGICDVKSPIITNHKKNLFDWRSIEGLVKNTVNDYLYNRKIKPFYVDKNKTYVLITKGTCSTNDYSRIIFLDNTDKHYLYNDNYLIMNTFYVSNFKENREFKTLLRPNKSGIINSVIIHGSGNPSTIYSIEEFGLFEADNIDDVEYEEYISNETILDQDSEGNVIKLRSLPNGVYDELDLETGILTQRIEEFIITPSKNLGLVNNYNTTNTICFNCVLPKKAKIYNQWTYNNFLNDKLNSDYWFNFYSTKLDKESITINIDNGTRVVFKINKSKLVTEDVNGLKTYLESNPITFQYELAEPITRKVNINDYPFAYKDGNVVLYSASNETSLTPTIEYTVPFNRNGQISMNAKLATRQHKQIDALETIIIANLVETQYRQSLTAINYELNE